MNKKIKQAWIKALRSGEYKQAKGALRRDGGFCCLGVLCNLHAQANPEIAALQHDPSVYMGSDTLLPVEVAKWAGIKTANRRYIWSKSVDIRVESGNFKNFTLAQINDTDQSFMSIADIIEKHL